MRKTTFGAVLSFAGALALTAPLTVPPLAPAASAAPLPSFSTLVKAAQPAVVTVRSALEPGNAQVIAVPPEAEPERERRGFFRRFFDGDRREDEAEDRQAPSPDHPEAEPATGLGSGFIIDPSGLIVTNYHVVSESEDITIEMADGTLLDAALIAFDEKTDLAVLRVAPEGRLPTVSWGDSDTVEVGDWAIAMGNPFGLGASVSLGIISATGRSINAGPYDDYFQIDAPINRGNSGGPLFDQGGRVIGVNSAIFSPSGGNVGIGFAMPANQARGIVRELLTRGFVERGWIGVSVQEITPAMAEELGLRKAEGALVSDVRPGGPAAAAGLRTGDIVTAVGDKTVRTIRDLSRAVADTSPGTTTTLRVRRSGVEQVLTVRTAPQPA